MGKGHWDSTGKNCKPIPSGDKAAGIRMALYTRRDNCNVLAHLRYSIRTSRAVACHLYLDLPSSIFYRDEPEQDLMISKLSHSSLINNQASINLVRTCTYPIQTLYPRSLQTTNKTALIPSNEISSTALADYKLVFYVPPGGSRGC